MLYVGPSQHGWRILWCPASTHKWWAGGEVDLWRPGRMVVRPYGQDSWKVPAVRRCESPERKFVYRMKFLRLSTILSHMERHMISLHHGDVMSIDVLFHKEVLMITEKTYIIGWYHNFQRIYYLRNTLYCKLRNKKKYIP